ncbi:MAG: exodeoxyribonuclease VII small subunit [Sphingomonadales bacterium]|nr:exodeoxyribonuclease VII small subunit [Sphingomonadales bacterium]
MSKTEELPKDIVELSFEDALSELEGIVSKLEAGDVGLEQSIDIYTRGTQLRQHCDSKLKNAKTRIDKITLSSDGQPQGSEDFNPE